MTKPAEQIAQPLLAEGTPTAERQMTQLQEHFLGRLDWLVQKKTEQMRQDPADKMALRLIARALYSTYMDLVANGLGDLAAERLEKAQASLAHP